MTKRIERAYGKVLSGTLKVINPIKKKVKKTECEVHLGIQHNALDILVNNNYNKEYRLFSKYIANINRGLVWADQDFKCYHHFYNPYQNKGKYGYEKNAMMLARSYYDKAIKFYMIGNHEKSMFYFGASCHLIQDLTVPQHAKGRLFDGHKQFETYVKRNYKDVARFKSIGVPIILSDIKSYADYNAIYAIKVDNMYRNVPDNTTRYYLTASKCLILAQDTTAGLMITFYKDLQNI